MSVHYTCPNHPSVTTPGASTQPINQGCPIHRGPCHIMGENRKNLPDYGTYDHKEVTT